MSNRESLIRGYFRPPDDGFWLWQDEGEAVGWSDGKLIAFAQELTFVLKQLAPNGLPRFGALLLLLASTRKNWAVDGSEARALSALLATTAATGADPSPQTETDHSRLNFLKRVLAGLHCVRALDRSLRESLEAKAALAAMVFEGIEPAVAPGDAPAVADAVRDGLTALLAGPDDAVSRGYGAAFLLKDLADLADGLDRQSPEAVRLRMETGLDAVPAAAPIDAPEDPLPVRQAARAVCNELLDSPEHAGMARAAMRLLAGTALPRKLSHAAEQEIGGYSDLANRGDPDRLLLSELAQDGLTLAVRVAMNEAMYLHRETPPSTPRMRRELLIDSGVHAWGVPRVLAASAALALAANTPDGAGFRAWRGSGVSLKEVDLLSTAGVVDHLGALEADPHLADALPEFASLLEQAEDAVEAVVIMPADALAEPAVAQALRGLCCERLYVATVDRHGEFRLCERGARGEKLIRRVQLSPDDLAPAATPLQDTADLDRLPAIFRVDRFPLRLSDPLAPKACWPVGRWGVLSITGDGRLLRWTDPKRGALQLTDRLPKGRLFWASTEVAHGTTSFVYGSPHSLVLYRVNIPRRDVEAVQLLCGECTAVAFHGGVLLGINRSSVASIDPHTGEVGQRLAIERDLRWSGGRYFRTPWGQDWRALSFDGVAPTLEPLPKFGSLADPVAHVWEAVGFSEPIALTRGGRLVVSRADESKAPSSQRRMSECVVEEISHDGLHLLIAGQLRNHTNHTSRLRLTLGDEPSTAQASQQSMDPRLLASARPIGLRKRFLSIGVSEAGELTLRAAKSSVALENQHGRGILRQRPRNLALRAEREFQPVDVDGGYRYRLMVATWPSGDRAVLDSRGLLHLQPASPDALEATLVLAEGELTGWLSDGMVFGKEYFWPEWRDRLPKNTDRTRSSRWTTIAKFVESLRAAD
ncbi:MAG: hypothetical protein AAGJ46_02480 [Planctomycetota bacterium]